MQKKLGIVVVAAIQGSAYTPDQAPRPGVQKKLRARQQRVEPAAVAAAA